MKIVYEVRYIDADDLCQTIEFVDVKEALNFIESGLHFISSFSIDKIRK